MSHNKLRAWFETFTDSDPFTMDVIGALVDVAESAGHVFAGHQSCDDGLTAHAREAIEALEDLETALDDAEIETAAAGMSTRPFVTARAAAELLGVPIETVVYDVHEGMDGKLGTLTGGIEGGYWLVQSSDLQGESLERHRKRLANDSSVAP